MQRAETGATRDYWRFVGSVVFDKRNYFIENITIKFIVTNRFMLAPHRRMHPAFIVHAVDRKDFYFSGINKWRNGINQLKPLIFEIIRGRSKINKSAKP